MFMTHVKARVSNHPLLEDQNHFFNRLVDIENQKDRNRLLKKADYMKNLDEIKRAKENKSTSESYNRAYHLCKKYAIYNILS